MSLYIHSIKDAGILREIAKTIRFKSCVLLIGLGLALSFPSEEKPPQRHLNELLQRMLQWCKEKMVISDDETINDFLKMLKNGELEKVERKMQEYFTDVHQKQQCLSEVIGQNHQQVKYIYQLLSQMSFRAYVTTSYDDFLETAYKETKEFSKLRKFYKSSVEEASNFYQEGLDKEPFILKLHGDTTSECPETITLNNRFIRSYLPEAIPYPEQLREILMDVNTLFIGFEKAEPDLEGLKSIVNKNDNLKRWLFVPEGHLTDIEANLFWTEDKITILSYADKSELMYFLRKLTEEAATPQVVEVYTSYSNPDRKIRNKLQQHLNTLHFPGLRITWNDGSIAPGQEKKSAIEERLKKADVILLMVSVDYLTSIDQGNIRAELKQAVERDHLGQARVIPIILRPCGWKYFPFARLAELPANGRPLHRASEQVYYEVAEAIKSAIEEWAQKH